MVVLIYRETSKGSDKAKLTTNSRKFDLRTEITGKGGARTKWGRKLSGLW